MRTPTPLTLEGEYVRLLPLLPLHAPLLWEVAQDSAIWAYMPVRMTSLADMEAFIADALAKQDQGTELPFAVQDKRTSRLVGSTRYLDIAASHRRLEIGSTWYAPAAQRTQVNTECKLLLLTHAFETLAAGRVCLKTDSRNLRSQRAIERLGAKHEGVLRAHMIMPDGYIRDTVFYSILPAEWPTVKHTLESALHAKRQNP